MLMDQKAEILQLIKDKPRHYVKIIKNNPLLFQWVNNHTLVTTSNFAEAVYSAVTHESNTCSYNMQKKFKSFKDGYTGCGPAKQCRCVRDAVSKKVKLTKLAYSADKKEEIQQKREQTNINIHGVKNVGQLAKAKENHRQFYSDSVSVQHVVQQVQQTKLEKYGNPHYNNSDQIKQTFRQKRSDGFWQQKWPEKNLDKLNDTQELTQLYKEKSPQEIADELGVHIQTVYKYLNASGIRKPYVSSDELEMVRYLESLGITNIIQNTRSVLPNKKELDIYLPDYNIAIEMNGVYWHHEDVDHITRSYHNEKFKMCEQMGIQLLTVFSNFWHSKKEIVKEIIKNKLGLNSKTYYARKLTVKSVPTADSKEFLNKYHVQGYTPATYRYGLYLGDMLVALTTFSKPRVGMGKASSDSIELVRYASKHRVTGGVSKILKHFINKHKPSLIISYSDNEWSTGNVYNVVGFTLAREIPPSYWYLKPREEKLVHRYNFANHKLVEQGHDPSFTEREITKSMGLLKLWDCGKRRWEMQCNPLSNIK